MVDRRRPQRTAMTRGNARTDETYDRLRAEFGDASPKASGYVSEYSFLRERELVLEAIGDEHGTIVDVACGGGLITLPLARAGRRVVGVDFNAAACSQAGRNGLAAIRGDAFNLPLADGIADVVVNVEFVQQYGPEAVQRMMHEAARVLRPAGRLVMVWSNRAALIHRAVSPVVHFLNRLHGRASFPLIGHAPSELQAMGERTGLALDRTFAIFPPLRLRLRRVDGALVNLIGTSFVAVFRKRTGP